jgi:hypothetical protein
MRLTGRAASPRWLDPLPTTPNARRAAPYGGWRMTRRSAPPLDFSGR